MQAPPEKAPALRLFPYQAPFRSSGWLLRFISRQYGGRTVVADYRKETTDALARREAPAFENALRARQVGLG
ncbi:hypothetical protein D2T29_17455 [Sinirhodobacter populi]|uniref:Uncharacterized protein n=1 Tax=Paenirhodobacter populi TaxID=2306993 RepID=A0A443K5C7_9RHOB|nr:hypothetical protein [Sinirhodobacter populi]RWR27977.1 hypothetical protein D2T29_17455 [Sinirhodobacter populi]